MKEEVRLKNSYAMDLIVHISSVLILCVGYIFMPIGDMLFPKFVSSNIAWVIFILACLIVLLTLIFHLIKIRNNVTKIPSNENTRRLFINSFAGALILGMVISAMLLTFSKSFLLNP